MEILILIKKSTQGNTIGIRCYIINYVIHSIQYKKLLAIDSNTADLSLLHFLFLSFSCRIDHLEAQVLSVSHLLTHHDVRLTKLESQVTELTDMVLKFSSCGAHFYKTKPEFEEALRIFNEVRTGRGSPFRWILAEKKNASSGDGGGGDGKESNEGTADSRTIKTDIDELRDRIAAVEHGMDAMHSLLSTSNDDVDRELAALSATMARLQEKVEELGDRWVENFMRCVYYVLCFMFWETFMRKQE